MAFTSERAEGSIIPFRHSASIVAQKFRVRDIDDSRPAKRRAGIIDSLDLGPTFESMGHVAKMHRLANSDAEPSHLIDFALVNEELNIMRQTIDSSPSVASGIACYSAYCDLMGGPYFPPTSIRVRRWGSFFNPCPTFSIYVGRLSKACQMMGSDSSGWIDSIAQSIIKGLKRAQDFPNRFDNFILRDLWVRILRWESIDSEFGRLC